MKRKLITVMGLVMMIALLFGAVGCGSPDEIPDESEPGILPAPASESTTTGPAEKSEPLTIGLVVKALNDTFQSDVVVGAQEAIAAIEAETGRKIELLPYESNRDLTLEISTLEDLTSMRVDGIMHIGLDYDGSVPAVTAILEAGIPYVMLDAPLANSDDVPAVVTSDNYEAGYESAKALAEAIGGKGKVLCFNNSTGFNINLRWKAAQDAFAEYPDLEVVFTENSSGLTVDLVLEKTNNFLQVYPDLSGIWGPFASCGRGAVSAVEAAGKLDQIKVASIDGTVEELELIKAGKLVATAAQFPKEIGAIGVETILKIIDGEELTETWVSVPVQLIDSSNVNEYLKD
ncbi:MAG: sugar ABC transporter substrate-binding protein [Christensenellales bacterium]|jgi:ribose transport system substrate-binding protein